MRKVPISGLQDSYGSGATGGFRVQGLGCGVWDLGH